MKRTCKGCRAFENNGCSLGYKTEKIYFQTIFLLNMKPLEECPKPKTHAAFIEAYEERKDRGNA